jgi:hypothetical protein
VRLLSLVLLTSLLWAADAPEQPLPFSHKQHAGILKLPCKMCHPNPNPGESMTIAPAAACMQCHSSVKKDSPASVKKDSPAIRKLAEYAKAAKPVPWARVYQIPSYVSYSHRRHLDAGSRCEECHGPVAERELLLREGDITMGGCMKCHQAKRVSIDCNFCHEPL